MKLNFRKITSVIASAIMLGSTAGVALAANAYPAPFVVGGVADSAIVVGANAQVTDMDAAVSLQTDLNKIVTATPTVSSTVTGENIQIDGPTKLKIDQNLSSVKSTSITKSDLPKLLGDVSYQSKDGQASTISQKIDLGAAMQFAHFTDSRSPISNNPTLGIKVDKNTVLNYTATFTPYIESDVTTAGRLEDIENTDITLLGKSYKLLNAYNQTSTTTTKLELMGGAVSDTLALGDSKDYTIGDKTYSVKISYVNTNEAKLEVNSETTTKMNIGSTTKLKDGTQLGIRDVNYQNYAGGVQSVEFSLGAEKLTLDSGNNIKINDVENTNVKATISRSDVSGKQRIDKIVLQWKPNDYVYLTQNSSLTMPGLASLSLLFTEYNTPVKESIKVANSGSKTIAITAPLKTGTVTIPILAANASTTTFFTKLGAEGSDTTRNLKTASGAGGYITYDTDNDEAFVATYHSGTAGESYYLTVSSISQSTGINYTTIKDLATSATAGTCDKIKSGDSCTIGSVTLTLSGTDYNGNYLNITGASTTYFDRLITKEGAFMYLPVINGTTLSTGNQINLSAANASATPTWTYQLIEEDKDGNIATLNPTNAKLLSGTVGWTSDKTEVKTVVQSNLSGGVYIQVPGTSTTYVGYASSDLGTKVTYDTVPTQDTVEFEYHGGQSVAKMFLAAAGASVSTSGSTNTVLVVTDDKIDSVKNKNLIVVGGSCINSVAAAVLNIAYPTCGSAFTTATNVDAGKYLIKTVASPYNSAKVAVLVAGYEAQQTTDGAAKLMTEKLSTDAGTSAIYPVAA